MVEVLKYIKGYLRIKVWGFSPERFMNLCSNKGILLWDIVREGDVYYMNINLRGFWALKPIVKKTGTRAAILERYGLPFFVPKLLKRKMFVGGLVLAVAFWLVSSSFIWNIQIDGNYQITDDVFQSFLKENQVSVGMRKDNLDIEELEKQIRREFPQITWASAKLMGTRLQIDIKENDAPISIEEKLPSDGRDLVAEFDGRVVSMIVRSGVPKVSIGDQVEKGTVLVEGRVPIYNEDTTVREYRYVDADGDILLEHVTNFTATLPYDHIEKVYTGREETRSYLKAGGNSWTIPGDRPFLVYDSVIKETRPLLFEKLSIPLYWGTVTHREYQNVEYVYTQEEVKVLLNQKLMVFLTSLEEKGVQIIEKNVKIENDGSSWVLRGDFLVWEPVSAGQDTLRPDLEEGQGQDPGQQN